MERTKIVKRKQKYKYYKEYQQEYYKKHKRRYAARTKKYRRRAKEKRFNNKVQLLFWIYNELEKVDKYERDYPYIPPLIIKRKRGRPKKPYIKSTVKKEFDWRHLIESFANVHRKRHDDPEERKRIAERIKNGKDKGQAERRQIQTRSS